jgi:hypothetical protein
LKLVKDGDEYYTASTSTVETYDQWLDLKDELITVFRDGEITKEYNFAYVRKNVGTW